MSLDTRQYDRESTGMKLDQFTLVERMFDEGQTRVVFALNFTKRSAGSYPLEWMVREIVQNFVDANPAHPGTLNGVSFEKQRLKEGITRYVISGQWPFLDYTGLVGLFTGKANQSGTAGGNGIGLKQTALGLFRDYGVRNFQIAGEGWEVGYSMMEKAEINNVLEERGMDDRVDCGFLLSHAFPSSNRGGCRYLIDTDNDEVVDAMDKFMELGVHKENKHLQNMSFVNAGGGFKWLAVKENESSDKPLAERSLKGALFINGQRYRFGHRYFVNEEYWGGPTGVTCRLDKIDYPMSVDRPPLSDQELTTLMGNIVEKMSRDELIEELNKSEYLWSDMSYKSFHSDEIYAIKLVESLVKALASKGFSSGDYKAKFGDKKYYAYLGRHEEEKQAISEGYKICPSFFTCIGMPQVKVKIKKAEEPRQSRKIKNHRAIDGDAIIDNLIDTCRKYGLEVPFENLHHVGCLQDLADVLYENDLAKHAFAVEGNPDTIHLFASDSIDSGGQMDFGVREFVMTKEPGMVATKRQRLAYKVKGIAYQCLLLNDVHDMKVIFDHHVVEFSESNGSLGLHLKDEHSKDVGIQLEFQNASQAEEFLECLKKAEDNFAKKKAGSEKKSDQYHEGDFDLPKRWLSTPTKIIAYIALAAAGILATPRAGRVVQDFFANDPNADAVSQSDIEAKYGNRSLKGSMNSWIDRNLMGSRGDDGRSADGLLAAYANTGVEPADKQRMQGGGSSLGSGFLSFVFGSDSEKPSQKPRQSHLVENLTVIENPIANHLRQLELLREYTELTTRVKVPNTLFVYTGKGANGINIGGRLIGLHIKLMSGNFETAVAIFNHEVAHNLADDGHGLKFVTTLQALAAAREDSLGEAGRLSCVEGAAPVNRRILNIEGEWDALRGSGK